MSDTTRHLIHLAGLALLFYLFALTARILGVMPAVAIFLPLGALFELRFWWSLFTTARDRRRVPTADR